MFDSDEKYCIKPGFCQCGCGNKTGFYTRNRKYLNIAEGETRKYISGHGTRGKKMSPRTDEQKQKMIQGRKEKYPRLSEEHKRNIKLGHRKRMDKIYSPFVPDTIIIKKRGRWVCHDRSHKFHAKMVWEYFNGTVPQGYVVHHKNGNPSEIESDRLDNLMLLKNVWNFQYFPTLARGFDLPESIITSMYCEIENRDNLSDDILFSELCYKLSFYKLNLLENI